MKKITAFLCLILSFIMLMSPVCTAAELCLPRALSSAAAPSLDYTHKDGYAQRAYISPADLLSLLISDKNAVSEAEAAYLNGYFDEYLYYSNTLPDSLVTIQETGEGKATVYAEAYSYTAVNGKTVTYLPSYVMVGENEYKLSDTAPYSAEVEYTEGDISVFYTGSLSIPKEIADRLLNFVFDEASAAALSSSELGKYSSALAEYKSYLKALEKYELDLDRYEEYIAAKEIYDEALIAYEQNLKDLEVYKFELAEYEQYKKDYAKYLSDMEAYKKEYAEYEQAYSDYRSYINDLGAARLALAPMESLFTRPSNGVRDLYSALQNKELVAMFEKYQGVLVSSFGVDPDDIKYLSKYSDRLNELLRGYSDKREISEEEAFIYYKNNYAEISKLFNGLYDRMNSILNPTIFNLICVKMEMEYGEEGEYKKWRLKNVLCHIYLICLCLDDTRTAESTWQFYGNGGDPCTYYFSDLLGQNVIITDVNGANPEKIKVPVFAEEPKEPPTMPTKPTVVSEPLKPLELPRPTSPTPVSEPTKPTPVSEPIEPEGLDKDLLLRAGDIIALLNKNELSKRDELSGDASIPLSASVTKRPSEVGKINVYHTDGRIETVGSIDELPEVDKEYSDERSAYSFVAWSQSPTELIPLESSARSATESAYPLYSSEPRSFKITFKTAENEPIEKTFYIGEFPTYDDINVEKNSSVELDYSFAGFTPALRRVEGEAVYEAMYESSPRSYTVTFDMGNKTHTQKYEYGSSVELPSPTPSYISGATLFEFSGAWTPSDLTVKGDVTYKAEYKQTALAEVGEGDISVTEGALEYTVSTDSASLELSNLLRLAASKGKGISILFSKQDIRLTVSNASVARLNEEQIKALVLSYNDEGAVGYTFTKENGSIAKLSELECRLCIPHDIDENTSMAVRAYLENGYYSDNTAYVSTEKTVEFMAENGVYYKTVKKFTVSFGESKNGLIYTDDTLCEEGEELTVFINPSSGYVCKTVKLENVATGDITDLGVCESFSMPAYDVRIYAEFSPVTYTVTFIYHGSSESFEYSLGEIPTPPEIPLSFTENGLFYTFIGWSSTVSTVTGDASYTAKYFSVSEESVVFDDDSAINAAIRKYVIPAAVIVLIVISSVVVLLIVLKKNGIRFKKKEKKEK